MSKRRKYSAEFKREAVIGNLVQLVVMAFLIWYSKQAESKGWIS